MKPANPKTEDMFEKAREAFFGPAKTTNKPEASSSKVLKPANAPDEIPARDGEVRTEECRA